METKPTQSVHDDSEFAYQVTIPVTVPSIGDYSIEGLKQELTAFALNLIHKKSESKTKETCYSARLQHLRNMSRNSITAQDIEKDERLAYLLQK